MKMNKFIILTVAIISYFGVTGIVMAQGNNNALQNNMKKFKENKKYFDTENKISLPPLKPSWQRRMDQRNRDLQQRNHNFNQNMATRKSENYGMSGVQNAPVNGEYDFKNKIWDSYDNRYKTWRSSDDGKYYHSPDDAASSIQHKRSYPQGKSLFDYWK